MRDILKPIFYLIDPDKDGSIYIGIEAGKKIQDCLKIIQKGKESPRIRFTNIVFVYVKDKFGDLKETPDLPISMYEEYRKKLEKFAKENREKTIEWLMEKAKEFRFCNPHHLVNMQDWNSNDIWSHYAYAFGASNAVARSQDLLTPDTYPIIFALAIAKNKKIEAPFRFEDAQLFQVEVYTEHFLFLNR